MPLAASTATCGSVCVPKGYYNTIIVPLGVPNTAIEQPQCYTGTARHQITSITRGAQLVHVTMSLTTPLPRLANGRVHRSCDDISVICELTVLLPGPDTWTQLGMLLATTCTTPSSDLQGDHVPPDSKPWLRDCAPGPQLCRCWLQVLPAMRHTNYDVVPSHPSCMPPD